MYAKMNMKYKTYKAISDSLRDYARISPDKYKGFISNDDLDLLQRATRMDFNNYLSGDILVKVDRELLLFACYQFFL